MMRLSHDWLSSCGKWYLDMPSRRVPSLAECGWCELTKADCSDRMEP